MPMRLLELGRAQALGANDAAAPLRLPPHHFSTHAVAVGMTGSGKTGLSIVLVEEALRSRVPVLMVDVKGDLANLFLSFPSLAGDEFEPWVDEAAARRDGKTAAAVAGEHAAKWREGLAAWSLGPADVAAFSSAIAPRLLTPGSTVAEPVHVLSALETRSSLWDEDEEAAREALSSTISLLLRLIDADPDPTKSRAHVLLSHLAERRLRSSRTAGIAALLADLESCPIATIGALAVDDFLPAKERRALAQQLNTLLASTTFATWQKGAPLDIQSWLEPARASKDEIPKTPAVIVSVAHLDDTERELVLGLLFEQLLAWVRGLAGTSDLRALVLFDEVFGFLPPHPKNPPTKRPLLALLKQARAFGVGLVLATQNPMDLDYKALSNAGVWFVGRLQTDADRERVVEGLSGIDGGAGGIDASELAATLKALPPRTFFVRDVHNTPPSMLLETRWSLAWLRGPMTRKEIGKLARKLGSKAPATPVTPEPPIAPVAPRPAEPAPVASSKKRPAPIDGWKSYYAKSDAKALTPWAGAAVVVHVTDGRLGLNRSKSARIAAPIGDDGRLDVARAIIPAASLDASPREGVDLAPIPEALRKPAAQKAAERACREQAIRSLSIEIQTHKDLGLVSEEGESQDAFVLRCRAAAALEANTRHSEVQRKWGPKLQKLGDRHTAALNKLQAIEAEARQVPGAVGTVLLNMFAGSRAAGRAATQQNRIEARLVKARDEVAEAESAVREGVRERDVEIAALARLPEDAHLGVETKTLTAKKGEVDVTELFILWM